MIALHDEMLLITEATLAFQKSILTVALVVSTLDVAFTLHPLMSRHTIMSSFQSGRLSALEPFLRTLTLMMGRFLYTNSTMTPTFSLTAFREQALNGCIS